MMRGAFEPIFEQTQGYRRIYLDLPGFGQTPAAPWIHNSDDMLDILCEFVDSIIGQENFLLTGCSYGGYLSLGLIHKMGARIDGVLLLVAMIDSLKTTDKPENLSDKQVLWQSEWFTSMKENPDLKGYMDMAVIATPQMYDKWQSDIQPGLDIADKNFISNHSIMDYSLSLEEALRKVAFDKPSCILAGRQDDIIDCCYVTAYGLAGRFSRATFATLDCAGHILHLDNESLFQQLAKDWIWRVELSLSTK
jgi:pimeloyl-ACP methyl ester carboxylesterase